MERTTISEEENRKLTQRQREDIEERVSPPAPAIYAVVRAGRYRSVWRSNNVALGGPESQQEARSVPVFIVSRFSLCICRTPMGAQCWKTLVVPVVGLVIVMLGRLSCLPKISSLPPGREGALGIGPVISRG